MWQYVAAAVGSQILGSVIGNMASAADRRAAAEAQKKALAEIERLGAGPDLARQIYLKEFESAGVLTPELENAVDVGVSKTAQIQEDPRFKKAQLEALSTIQQLGKTGLTPEERLALTRERAQAERSAESKRQQILSGLRARGALDSGAGIAAQLQSADELAALQAEASDRASASAAQRALQAITQAGTLGGQIRGQEFDITRTKTAAEDEMNRFNVSQQIARQQRNIERQNAANQFNLQQQQAIMNANIQQANAERIRQLQGQQQMYENEMRIAQMRAGAYGAQAQQSAQQAAQKQQAWGQTGQAIGQGISSYGQYAATQPLQQAQINYYNAQAGIKPPPVPPQPTNSQVPLNAQLQQVTPLGTQDYMNQTSSLPDWMR